MAKRDSLASCYGRHRRPVTRSKLAVMAVMADTAGLAHVDKPYKYETTEALTHFCSDHFSVSKKYTKQWKNLKKFRIISDKFRMVASAACSNCPSVVLMAKNKHTQPARCSCYGNQSPVRSVHVAWHALTVVLVPSYTHAGARQQSVRERVEGSAGENGGAWVAMEVEIR